MTKTKTAKSEPTAAQWAALQAFAAAHGRTWKQALRDAWMSGDGRDAGELRQLRNQFGPSWLTRVDITKAPAAKLPVPVKTDSRICFGIAYYLTEGDAQAAAAAIARRGDTYNGGWFHGMPCGRDTTWDHRDPVLGMLYAVTTR